MKKSSIGNKIKRLISTAIALSLLIAPIASTNKVYADNGYNTDGSNGGSNTVSGTGSGGVSVNKTGVLFYCVDSRTGEVLTRQNNPNDQGQQPDGSFIHSDGSVTHVGDVHIDPSGQRMTYLGYAGF